MSLSDLIEAAARAIDPEAFAEPPKQRAQLTRRDAARRAAGAAFMIFEANRLGVLGDAAQARLI